MDNVYLTPLSFLSGWQIARDLEIMSKVASERGRTHAPDPGLKEAIQPIGQLQLTDFKSDTRDLGLKDLRQEFWSF